MLQSYLARNCGRFAKHALSEYVIPSTTAHDAQNFRYQQQDFEGDFEEHAFPKGPLHTVLHEVILATQDQTFLDDGR